MNQTPLDTPHLSPTHTDAGRSPPAVATHPHVNFPDQDNRPPECHPKHGQTGLTGVIAGTGGQAEGPGHHGRAPWKSIHREKKSLGHQPGGLAADPNQGETLCRFLNWLSHPPPGAKLQKQLAEGMQRNSCHKGTLLCVPAQCQLSAKRVPQDVLPFLACLTLRLGRVLFFPLSPHIGEPAPQIGGSRQQLAPSLPAGERLKCPVELVFLLR